MTPIPNTFALPARANRIIEIDSEEMLVRMLPTFGDEPLFIIGAGSNLIFLSDWPGTVLHSAITDVTLSADGLLRVGSGVVMDELIARVTADGLWGLENLSGIPGEAGASAVQNVGAYGVEAADLIVSVEAVNIITGEKRVWTAEECRYGYRDSVFKHNGTKSKWFITYVTYRLSREPRPVLGYPALRDAFADHVPESPEEVREKILAIRALKLPDPAEVPSAGSFFKNPVVSEETYNRVCGLHPDRSVPHYPVEDGIKIPAAFLIEQCGWKGYDNGRVAVWHKQPLVLTNPRRQATAADLIDLEERIARSVSERYGIALSPEAEHVNFVNSHK